MTNYLVKPVTRFDCRPFIINIHYAKRFPSISYAFGLFRDSNLVGIVTYGTPPSSTLRVGIAGSENQKFVIELNRLCLKDNLKNEATYLIAQSIRKLPKPLIIISFADTSHGHRGTVYQAANFTYYGLSAKRKDWKIKGKEHLHGQTIADEFRGIPDRAKAMREKYGSDFYLENRPLKHRYIYLHGHKKWKKQMLRQIRYKQLPYPK